MQISYDVDKRSRTLLERGLDFEDSLLVFKGRTFEFLDDRRDYGERRVICVGELMGRMVIVGYVQRGS